VLLALGLIADLTTGFSFSRRTGSLAMWPVAMLGLGVLWLVGEGTAERLLANDKVTDPLAQRVVRLLAMLALWGAFMLVWWAWGQFVS
jgi:hypothetical protein